MPTAIDEMVETFKDACLNDPRTPIKDGLIAVLRKHFEPIIAEAAAWGVLVYAPETRTLIAASANDEQCRDYAADRISHLTDPKT